MTGRQLKFRNPSLYVERTSPSLTHPKDKVLVDNTEVVFKNFSVSWVPKFVLLYFSLVRVNTYSTFPPPSFFHFPVSCTQTDRRTDTPLKIHWKVRYKWTPQVCRNLIPESNERFSYDSMYAMRETFNLLSSSLDHVS